MCGGALSRKDGEKIEEEEEENGFFISYAADAAYWRVRDMIRVGRRGEQG